MNQTVAENQHPPEPTYFLSEIIGARAVFGGKVRADEGGRSLRTAAPAAGALASIALASITAPASTTARRPLCVPTMALPRVVPR